VGKERAKRKRTGGAFAKGGRTRTGEALEQDVERVPTTTRTRWRNGVLGCRGQQREETQRLGALVCLPLKKMPVPQLSRLQLRCFLKIMMKSNQTLHAMRESNILGVRGGTSVEAGNEVVQVVQLTHLQYLFFVFQSSRAPLIFSLASFSPLLSLHHNNVSNQLPGATVTLLFFSRRFSFFVVSELYNY
jgi:hypothetical protein